MDEIIPKQVLKNSKKIENKLSDDNEEMGSEESEYESDSSFSHSHEKKICFRKFWRFFKMFILN